MLQASTSNARRNSQGQNYSRKCKTNTNKNKHTHTHTHNQEVKTQVVGTGVEPFRVHRCCATVAFNLQSTEETQAPVTENVLPNPSSLWLRLCSLGHRLVFSSLLLQSLQDRTATAPKGSGFGLATKHRRQACMRRSPCLCTWPSLRSALLTVSTLIPPASSERARLLVKTSL